MNGFWIGGGSELRKAIDAEYQEKIANLQSKLDFAADPTHRAELEARIEAARARWKSESGSINDKIF